MRSIFLVAGICLSCADPKHNEIKGDNSSSSIDQKVPLEYIIYVDEDIESFEDKVASIENHFLTKLADIEERGFYDEKNKMNLTGFVKKLPEQDYSIPTNFKRDVPNKPNPPQKLPEQDYSIPTNFKREPISINPRINDLDKKFRENQLLNSEEKSLWKQFKDLVTTIFNGKASKNTSKNTPKAKANNEKVEYKFNNETIIIDVKKRP